MILKILKVSKYTLEDTSRGYQGTIKRIIIRTIIRLNRIHVSKTEKLTGS